tara:strand:+ start:491 stop:928 length:438 start_codon:yes stop_codon:yes gene_type:complete
MYYSTKYYHEIGSCTHRQPKHKGHCKYVHGYARSFKFKFGAKKLTQDTCFVVEFGALKEIKKWLKYYFDHTFLINKDDSEIEKFQQMHDANIIQLRILPNVSMEATAQFVFEYVNNWIKIKTDNRAWLVSCECIENSKNSGIYEE